MRAESHIPRWKGDCDVGGTGDDGGDRRRVGDRVVSGDHIVELGGGEGRHDDASGIRSDSIRIHADTLLQSGTQVWFWIPVKIPAEYDSVMPRPPENAKIKIL